MITVASYNIHKAIGADLRRNPDRILAVLAEIGADIVALQEADQRFGARAGVLPLTMLERAGWHPVTFGVRAQSMGWHGNMILIRQGATIIRADTIHLPRLEPRGAVMADVRMPDGMSLRLVGMHLDLSGLRRRRQALAIIAAVEGATPLMPCVLMGDLNEWSASMGCLHEFARPFRIAETGASFPARAPLARLDRIMMTRDMQIIDCGVHDSRLARRASDHLPVWARLEGGT
jgi:endonuclease/exonuclease/phosphatase family metal-dependent hydrolase